MINSKIHRPLHVVCSYNFTLEHKGVIIIFKNVPALVCGNCGNFYMTTETTKMLLERASKTVEKGVEVEIINLKPAA